MMFVDNGTTGSLTPTNAWTAWNGVYTLQLTTASASTTGTGDSWILWNNLYVTGTASAASGTASDPWNIWNRLYAPSVIVRATPPPETAAQREAREVRQRLTAEIERQRKEKEVAAKAKAEKLLVEHLSAAQRDQLVKHGYFDVEVGGEVYRIKRGYAGNVELLDAAKQRGVERFCIHPTEHVPDADAMLGQKLLLEANEDEFRRIANKTKLS